MKHTTQQGHVHEIDWMKIIFNQSSIIEKIPTTTRDSGQAAGVNLCRFTALPSTRVSSSGLVIISCISASSSMFLKLLLLLLFLLPGKLMWQKCAWSTLQRARPLSQKPRPRPRAAVAFLLRWACRRPTAPRSHPATGSPR